MLTEKEKKQAMRLLLLLVFLLVSVGCYAVLRYVVPMGDDLFYGRWGRWGFQELFSRMAQHYHTANGRNLVHVLDCLLLASDFRIGIARLFVAALLGTVAVNLTRLTAAGLREAAAIAVLCACGVFLLPPDLTRQSVYWITGAMNYVLPLALLLEYWVLLRASLAGKRGWRLTAVFALLTGLTVEQISVMAVGLTVLLVGEHWLLRKNPFPHKVWPSFALALAGMLTVVFAPGNFYRASITVPPVEGGTLAVIRYNVLQLRQTFLFGDTLFPIHFLVMTAVPLYLLMRTVKGRAILDGIFAAISAVVFAAWYWLPESVPELLSSAKEVPGTVETEALAILAGYLLTVLYAAIRAAMDGERTPLAAYILGAGSQVMMLVSPTVGPRTMLCCVGMLLLAAAVLVREAPYLYLLGAGSLLAWHWGQAWAAAVVLLATALWLARRYCPARALCAVLCCVPLLFCGWTMLKNTYDGYRRNAAFDAANRAAIAAYDGGGSLTLRRFPDDLYGWVMPYHNSYYDGYYKEFYGLPLDTELVWED